jgi:hypothetical protein
VAVSPDDRFAFVSLEDSASIAVYSLQRALAKGRAASRRRWRLSLMAGHCW